MEVIGKGRSSLIRRTFPLSVSLQIFLHIDPKYSHEKSPKHTKFKILLEICNVHSSRAVCSKCKIHLNRFGFPSFDHHHHYTDCHQRSRETAVAVVEEEVEGRGWLGRRLFFSLFSI